MLGMVEVEDSKINYSIVLWIVTSEPHVPTTVSFK
jgi:hypothetical protein